MYYNVCNICGGNLDPGEKCDCLEQTPAAERKQTPLKILKSGQVTAHHNTSIGVAISNAWNEDTGKQGRMA